MSWVVPTVQAWGATCAIGTPFHSWQFTGQGKTDAAHKGMVNVAKIMAGTAIDALRDPALIRRAKDEHQIRTGGKPFVSPLGQDTSPPLHMNETA